MRCSAHYLGAVGRYAIYDELARGGMATVHLGRLRGAAGFSRIVALKRLHAQFATDPVFVSMFTDEARLCARIRHPNVVPILDVVASDDELFMVMEFVHGETLGRLIVQSRQSGAGISAPMSVAILSGVLHGLHAAHEAMNERGEPLDIVHRDVSPQNIIVGVDGVARVLDFGVAKATGRQQTTEVGLVKGKYGYMSPEQLYGDPLDRRTDVYAAGVVLWEMLVGERLFAGVRDEPAPLRSLAMKVDPPGSRVPGLSPRIDEVVMRALAIEPSKRFPTALAMAHALEACTPMVKPAELGAWVRMCAVDAIESRGRLLASLEQTASPDDAPFSSSPRQEVSRRSLPGAPVARGSGSVGRGSGPVDREPGSIGREPGSVDRESGSIGREPGSVGREPPPSARESGATGFSGAPTTIVEVMPGRVSGDTGALIESTTLVDAAARPRPSNARKIAAACALLGVIAMTAFVSQSSSTSSDTLGSDGPAAPVSSGDSPGARGVLASGGSSADPRAAAATMTTSTVAPSASANHALVAASASEPNVGSNAGPGPAIPAKTAPMPTLRGMRPSCNPPYVIDKEGVRIYKKECL